MKAPTLSEDQKAAGYEYQFRCGMCGNEVDVDHCYCRECQDHSGEWELVDEDGEQVELS